MIDAGKGDCQHLQGIRGFHDLPRIGIIRDHHDILAGAAALQFLNICCLLIVIRESVSHFPNRGSQSFHVRVCNAQRFQ